MRKSLYVSLLVLALAVSACAPAAASAAAPTAPPAAVASTLVPTSAPPATAAPADSGYGDSSYGSYGSSASASNPPAASGASTPTLKIGSTAAVPSFLVDANGMSLYAFMKDTPGTSSCYGQCASLWPPLTVSGSAVPGDGVDASKLGTTIRTDGSQQLTYNGRPLYFFARDAQPGDTNGEGINSVWYLISPAGDPIK